MSGWRSLVAPLRRLRIDARQVAIALLAVWFLGLVGAAVQLERWQEQLSRTLLQLAADKEFRARVSQRDEMDPQWYRRKALVLLAALEKVRRDSWWTLSIPGSWNRFDDLEERLAARMEREFGDIVLETLRRELSARGSRLTGAPLAPGGADLRSPIECAAPPVGRSLTVPATAARNAGRLHGVAVASADSPFCVDVHTSHLSSVQSTVAFIGSMVTWC